MLIEALNNCNSGINKDKALLRKQRLSEDLSEPFRTKIN